LQRLQRVDGKISDFLSRTSPSRELTPLREAQKAQIVQTLFPEPDFRGAAEIRHLYGMAQRSLESCLNGIRMNAGGQLAHAAIGRTLTPDAAISY
jgi:hypothetical protein